MRLEVKTARTGEEVLIDSEDYNLVKDYRWHIIRGKRDGYTQKYVQYSIPDPHDFTSSLERGYLHRLITGAPKGMVVDHINGNGLDNRRCNLRVVTRSENLKNRHNNLDRKRPKEDKVERRRYNKTGRHSKKSTKP